LAVFSIIVISLSLAFTFLTNSSKFFLSFSSVERVLLTSLSDSPNEAPDGNGDVSAVRRQVPSRMKQKAMASPARSDCISSDKTSCNEEEKYLKVNDLGNSKLRHH
jgi:hypothetical protein